MSCDVTVKVQVEDNLVTLIQEEKPVTVQVTPSFVIGLSAGTTDSSVTALVGNDCPVTPILTESNHFAVVRSYLGTVGPAGSNGLNGNTILNGASDPGAGDGNNGDFFINTATFYIFGPKAAGVWPVGTFLGGSKILTGAGVPAPALQGDSYLYIDTATGKVYYKVTGSWIDTGLYFHLTTTTLPEGTNLYFTDARARTASVADTIVDGVTTIAPSQNAVFDALALKQPLDTGLTALAAYNTNGLLVQTANDVFVGRLIAGTASNISVTNGDGVAGNPTIDLINAGTAGTYTNPRSITTDSKGRVTAISSGDNPESESILFDEFIAGLNSSSLGWLETRTGANAFATIVASGSEAINKAQGCIQLSTGTTATGRTAHSLEMPMGIGYTTIIQKWRMWLPSLSSALQEYNFIMGLGDTVAGIGIAQVNEISFVYDRTVSVNWICQTTKASVTTQTTTATVVNSAGFVNFEIRINAAGTSVDFLIGGAIVATHVLNIPGFIQFVGPMAKISKSVGTTAMLSLIDYFWQKINWAVAR